MQVVSGDVGRAARAWDEQHLDLVAAAAQIEGAPTDGFTGGVSGAAIRFTAAWARHATGLGDRAEQRADGLRSALADFLATDAAVGLDVTLLRSYLGERR